MVSLRWHWELRDSVLFVDESREVEWHKADCVCWAVVDKITPVGCKRNLQL